MSAELLSPLPETRVVTGPRFASPGEAAASHVTAFFRRPFGALCTLLAAVLVVYAPSLNAQFLWDDLALVRNNLLIRSPRFGVEIFRHTLFNGDSNFYRPTQTLVFLADYWCWALNPFGYHLTSVLIHAANAFLLCLVLRRTLPVMLTFPDDKRRTDWMALGLALLWAVHPVHSAAVAYVSGSADSLAMMFCLSAWLLCERALRATQPVLRTFLAADAFGCLLFGLCSKEIAGIWLLLYFGYLFTLRPGTSGRGRWTVVLVGVAAVGIYVGLRHLPPAPPSPPPLPPLPAKSLLMLRALGDYGSLMLFPDKLFMERQVFAAPGLANPADASVYFALGVAGVMMLVAFTAGVLWRGRGQTLRRVGVVWFMVGFLPVSNLFSLNASVAEHWLYLPSIGFLLFLAGVALDMPPLFRGRGALAALAVVILLLGMRTWFRTFDWMDELTFFRQTIADGGDVPRARAGLAAAYRRADADGDAIAVLRDVVARYPNVLSSRINLANALARQGNLAEAKSLLERTAADLFARGGNDPREVLTTIKGLDQLEAGDPAWPEHRHALFASAVRRHPDSWELVEFGTNDFLSTGDSAQALALVRHYAAAHWWHEPSHYALGRVEADRGDSAAALADWAEAARLDVYDAASPSAAAVLCLQQNRLGEAHDWQAMAVRRQPDSPRARVLFAEVLQRQGNDAEAGRQLARADQMMKATDR